MKHVYSQTDRTRKTVMRDAHLPERIYVKTETADRPGLERNKQIRSSELMPQDSRNALADGDVIAFAFSFPTTSDYFLLRKREPDLFAEIDLGGNHSLRAAEKLAILYPGYVITTKRNDSRRT